MDKPQQKILHITPHFAPEQCGVTDYVLCWQKWLGGEKEIFIAALSDRYNPGILNRPGLLRVGAEQTVSVALKQLENLLETHSFDAAVIHYVPQGYSRSGIPYWLSGVAKLLVRNHTNITLLAHELWLGGPGKPLKLRIKGWLQKQFLVHLIKLLNRPSIITTSAFTAGTLDALGFPASFCPVFSNVGEVADGTALPGGVINAIKNGSFTHVFMFGSIPPDAHPKETASFLTALTGVRGKPLRIWHAGHASPAAFEGVSQFVESSDVKFEHLGPLPAPAINWLMKHCHWGLSTYPVELWSKSGSIAAMLANGLPVAVTGKLPGASLAIPGSLPEKLVAWPMLKAEERNKAIAIYEERANHLQQPYNSLVAKRLHALTGLGIPPQTGTTIPLLSVVITVYRCWPQAMKCLEHLFAAGNMACIAEVLLINDDPEDPAPDSIKGFEGVKVVQNGTNLGYVGSVNRGISLAARNLVLLLDADAFLLDNLQPAIELACSDAALKLVLPAARMESGLAVRRLYPAPVFSSLLFGQAFEVKMEKFQSGQQAIAHSYAWMLHRNDFLALGGLDPKLHFLEADVDYCMRLQQKYPGSVVVCEAVRVIHEGGANPIKRNQRVLEWYRSRWYLLSKHGLIPFKTLGKGLIAFRLYLETGFSALLSHLQPGRNSFWHQKTEGRKMLLKDLKNW